MPEGIRAILDTKRIQVILGSILIVVASLLLAGLVDFPDWFKLVLQAISAIFGALLGAYFQRDKAVSVMRTQSGSATRQLLDHNDMIRQLVVLCQDARQSRIKDGVAAKSIPINEHFSFVAVVERDARALMQTTRTAIDAWSDLDAESVKSQMDQRVKRDAEIQASVDGQVE